MSRPISKERLRFLVECAVNGDNIDAVVTQIMGEARAYFVIAADVVDALGVGQECPCNPIVESCAICDPVDVLGKP